MNSISCAASLLLTVAAVGCGPHRTGIPSDPPEPPTPPKACSAVWHGLDRMESGDTVVIARCSGADEYSTTSASKDWNYHWYLVSMDVLMVEKGTWTEKEVNFVYPDEWPTPESGIRLKKAVFPFAKGHIVALTLRTSAKPAAVVAFERRSYVAPHGPLKLIALKPGKVDAGSEYGRILKAVADFEAAHNVPSRQAVTETPEDVGDIWIVHRRDGWGTNAQSWLYKVNKTTFTVQAIP